MTSYNHIYEYNSRVRETTRIKKIVLGNLYKGSASKHGLNCTLAKSNG